MWKENEKVILDFAGTDPQSESSINFYLNENMFKMFFGIYMVMVFDPQVMFNDGFYDLVDVRIPGRLAAQAEVPRRPVLPHPCARAHLRRAGRAFGPEDTRSSSVRRRLLLLAPT